MKPKIVGIGITGLIGSRVAELLSGSFDFINASSETGVDITNPKTLIDPIEKSSADIALHLAAKTNVDDCEKDKGEREKGQAWKINVIGTKNVIESCKKAGKKIIYISTDYVFDGTKDEYFEEDQPRPVNWYGETKFQGEKLIKSSGLSYLICRSSYPYRAEFPPKKDFVRSIIERLKGQERVNLMIDHIFTPTFIDNIAQALKILIIGNHEGIFHLVGGSHTTPYEAGLAIAREFNLDKRLIGKTTSIEYLKNRAPRPLKLALNNDKIGKLGAVFVTFKQGLKILRTQMEAK